MNLCCLSLLLVLAAGQVKAQIPAGDACDLTAQNTPATTCITNTFCDAVEKKCLFIVGQTCTASVACVAGSVCPSGGGTCPACSVTDYTTSGDVCEFATAGLVGDVCANDAACTTPEAVCGTHATTKLCSCSAGFVTVTSGNTCGKIAIGGACTTDTAAACIATSTCDLGSSKCRLKVDESCAGDNSGNCVSGATCTSDTCSCNTDVSTENAATKICTPKAGYAGASCSGDGDCTADNTKCNTVCVCKDTFTFDAPNLKCVGGATALSVSVVMLAMAALVSLVTTRH